MVNDHGHDQYLEVGCKIAHVDPARHICSDVGGEVAEITHGHVTGNVGGRVP